MRGVVLTSVAVAIAAVAALALSRPDPASTIVAPEAPPRYSGFFEFDDLVDHELRQVTTAPISDQIHVGITSHHLPVAVSFIAEFYQTFAAAPGPRGTFVVVGPDHTERCHEPATTSTKPYLTPFGELAVDERITSELVAAGVALDDTCLDGEHSIDVQTIFIKRLFPEARIVPVTLSASTPAAVTAAIAEVILAHRDDIAVVASVDFSHYQTKERADTIDAVTEQMIRDLDVSALTLEHVDSPPSVALAVAVARGLNASPVVIGRANSADFTGRFENTTGYLNILIVSNPSAIL